MKIVSLNITFKNLKNVVVHFQTRSILDESVITVVLGRNGTGKSYLLEALITIFRDLELGRPPFFKYQLVYICRNREISIDADPNRSSEPILIKVDGIDVTYTTFWQEANAQHYLPSYVFGYYSGSGNRMEALFDEHQTRLYEALVAGIEDERKLRRPLLYARPVYGQFALLSFFCEEDETIRQFLTDHLGIVGFDSATFILKEPPWWTSEKEGNPRFWNARGVISRFLDNLYGLAPAPLRFKHQVRLNFKGGTTLEHMYLYLKGVEALKSLASVYPTQQEFFKALESTYIAEILSEVRIRVKVRNANGSLEFRDLSEGEQQLLMVLGLLRFTKEDEALFLLDEPDTHLNPAWSIQYMDFIHQVAGPQRSHIIMATHNPLVISSLNNHQVLLMVRNEETNQIYARQPTDSPERLSVDNILSGDLFGLRSAVGPPLQRLIDERRRLGVKDHLTEEELARLGELNQQLASVDFSTGWLDGDYARFVRRKIEREQERQKQFVLTPQQLAEQEDLIQEILDELNEDDNDYTRIVDTNVENDEEPKELMLALQKIREQKAIIQDILDEQKKSIQEMLAEHDNIMANILEKSILIKSEDADSSKRRIIREKKPQK